MVHPIAVALTLVGGAVGGALVEDGAEEVASALALEEAVVPAHEQPQVELHTEQLYIILLYGSSKINFMFMTNSFDYVFFSYFVLQDLVGRVDVKYGTIIILHIHSLHCSIL